MAQSVVPCVNIKCSTDHKSYRHFFTLSILNQKIMYSSHQQKCNNWWQFHNYLVLERSWQKILKMWKINNFLYAVQLLYHNLYPIRSQLLKTWGTEDITIFLSCIVIKLYYQRPKPRAWLISKCCHTGNTRAQERYMK